MTPITIQAAMLAFLTNIENSKKKKNGKNFTYLNYKSNLLGEVGLVSILPKEINLHSPIDRLTEKHGLDYIQSMLDRGLEPATRHRAASVLREFFGFCAVNYDAGIDLTKFKYSLKHLHLLGKVNKQPAYPGEKIERVLDYCKSMTAHNLEDLRNLAFIFLLSETGIRVSEACSLKVGDIDRHWQISFIRKGGKPSVIDVGKRARLSINKYLKARAVIDMATEKPRGTLALFARHDKTSGKGMVKGINQETAQGIIHKLTYLALGEEYDPKITCHKFRHYFITAIYNRKGDLKEAQELADHVDISTTQRYAHRDKRKNREISREVFG